MGIVTIWMPAAICKPELTAKHVRTSQFCDAHVVATAHAPTPGRNGRRTWRSAHANHALDPRHPRGGRPDGRLGGHVAAGGRPIVVEMTGAQEAPGPGDPDGTGTASFWINPGQQELCFVLEVQNIAAATAAHIHLAPVGVPGPVVIPLTPPTTGTSSGCVSVDRELLVAILHGPVRLLRERPQRRFPAGRSPRPARPLKRRTRRRPPEGFGTFRPFRRGVPTSPAAARTFPCVDRVLSDLRSSDMDRSLSFQARALGLLDTP